ncbi:unnamed protein product [Meganyctiphanes norvegica]|uniref:Galectin n=1 Tax=Meganyctiphanes norvegica TaxID=48144 RepID=A0AAV2Q6M3_MEGNR
MHRRKGESLDLGDGNGIGRFNLTEGFHPGGSIIVSGTLKSNAKGFITNLEESSSKYYLHINADIDTKELVFSHKDDNKWASKFGFNDTTTNLTSLCPGGNFDLTIISLETGYKIQMNKTLCYFFNYRFNTLNIRNIRFAGNTCLYRLLMNHIIYDHLIM